MGEGAWHRATLSSRAPAGGGARVARGELDRRHAGHPGGSVRVDHDLAYESGYAEAHFANGMVRNGRFSTVWKIQGDGHWKIFRNLSLPPAPK